MKKNDPITRIMSTSVATVQIGQPLSDVRKVMCNQGVHHVPVIDGERLVGLISFTDMMKINLVVNGADERNINTIIDQQFAISDVMTRDIKTIKNTETIRQASEILVEGSFHSLPVVNEQQSVVGIVTSTDLIRYLHDQY